MKKYLVIVELAIKAGDEYLLITRPMDKHAAGLLCFPGGKIDENDEHQNTNILKCAAKREIEEEVGISIKTGEDLEYITSNYFKTSDGICVINTVFYCPMKEKPKVTPKPDEVPEYGWFTVEQIMTAPNSPQWLKRYVSLIEEKLAPKGEEKIYGYASSCK